MPRFKIPKNKIKITPLTLAASFAAISLTGYLIFFMPSKAHAAWYNQSWAYRRQLTIDHTKVANTDQSNFPVLVSLTDRNLRSLANNGYVSQSSGNDIVFTASDGTTLSNYEIEKYVPTTGELEAWVRVPTLSHTADTVLYMYYGNASAAANTSANSQATWNSTVYGSASGVWHMGQSSAPVLDSTSNSNAALNVDNATVGAGSPVATSGGQIDGAWDFTTNGSYLNAGNSSTVSTKVGTSFSVSGWAKITSTHVWPSIAGRASSTSWTDGWGLFYNNGSNAMQFYVGVYTTHFATKAFTDVGPGAGWHFFVGTYDHANLKVYIDGVAGTNNAFVTTPGNLGNFQIGAIGSYTDENAVGPIDEVQLASVALTPDWIQTEYNNQGSPSTFMTMANQEQQQVPAPVWYNSSWGYRKAITIDHTKVGDINNTDQTNFPVLISETSDASLKVTGSGGHVGKSDGSDILFTLGDGSTLLNYEIENYVSTTGEVEAWVKIPTLSHTADTTIYMYYGNASAPANTSANIIATWNNAYKGVWHLADNAANTTVVDSSGLDNGTAQRNTSLLTTSGQVANAFNLNGASDYVDLGTNVGSYTLSDPFTISAWINPTLNSADHAIYGNAYANAGYLLRVTIANKLRFILITNGTNYVGEDSSTLSAGWHYVTGTWTNTGAIAVYVDGVLDNASSLTSGSLTTITTTQDTRIGATPETGSEIYYKNIIDEVRTAKAARSADWINTEYNNQSSPSSFESFLPEEAYSAPTPATPAVPSLIAPAASATALSVLPEFQFRSTDANAGYLQYILKLYSGTGTGTTCTGATVLATATESSSHTGWLSEDATNNGGSYHAGVGINDSTVANYQYPTALSPNTTYSWQAEAIDTAGSSFSGFGSCQSFTTGASEVQINGGTNVNGGSTIQ